MQDLADRLDAHARQLRAMQQSVEKPFPGALAPIQALIQQEVARQLAALPQASPVAAKSHTEEMLMVLLEKNLPAADMAWLTGEHIPAGAPGFVEFLQSDTAKALVQMAFDAYKEFLSGQRK